MTHAPRFLGLDLANRTGWAVADGNKIIASGVRDFSLKKDHHPGLRGKEFYNFLVKDIGYVDEIYYEKIMFTGGNTRDGAGNWRPGMSADGRELYHGLVMIMNMFAAEFHIPTIGIHPSTLKKAFAGHGRAEKADMCRTAREYGWTGGTLDTALYHDEVDAIALVVTQLRERHGVRASF